MFDSLFERTGVSLERLRTLCLVAEAGGIAAAAAGDLSRQALFSKQLRELEECFGAELTTRAGRTLKLTAAGARLAGIVRSALGALDDFAGECRATPRVLRVMTSNSGIEWLLLPRIAELQAALPGTEWRFSAARTDACARAIADMRAEVAVLRRDAVPAGMKSRTVGRLKFALFVPAADATLPLAELLARRPVATTTGGSFRKTLDAAAKKARVQLRIALGCESFTHAARALRGGKYAAILPDTAAAELPGFAAVPLPFLARYTRDLALAWHPRAAAVRGEIPAVVEALARVLSGQIALGAAHKAAV